MSGGATRRDTLWPATRSPGVGSLVAVFVTLGYTACADVAAEPLFDRVVVYAKDGIWTHAAWQAPSGWWASKLGAGEDIEHETPDCLCGESYGTVHCVMRRPRTPE